MREKDIEQQLIIAVKKMGGICPKFVSPGWAGAPDRLILLPKGALAFAELKNTGKRMRPLQESRKKKLESLGYKVYVIDEKEQIGGILDEIQST